MYIYHVSQVARFVILDKEVYFGDLLNDENCDAGKFTWSVLYRQDVSDLKRRGSITEESVAT